MNKGEKSQKTTDNHKLTTIPGRFTKNMQSVLLEVAKGNCTVITVSNTLKKNKGNVCRTLNKLVNKGLLTQQDKTRHYFVTSYGKDIALKLTTKKVTTKVTTTSPKESSTDNQSTTKRGHNFRVKYKIIKSPKGWRESPKKFFKMQDIEWEELNLKQVDGVQFSYDDYFVKAMRDNVVVFVDVQEDIDSMIVLERLIRRAWDFKKRIERRFSGLRLTDFPKITTQEFAHEQDIVAKLKNKYTVIRHSDGYVRVQIDKSKGIELEFMHPGMADSDSERWQKQVISILDSPYLYGELAVRTEQEEFRNDEQDAVLNQIEKYTLENAKQLGYFGENMVAHVKAVQNISSELNRFGDVVEEQLTGLRQMIVTEIRKELKKGAMHFLSEPSGPPSSSQSSTSQSSGSYQIKEIKSDLKEFDWLLENINTVEDGYKYRESIEALRDDLRFELARKLKDKLWKQ